MADGSAHGASWVSASVAMAVSLANQLARPELEASARFRSWRCTFHLAREVVSARWLTVGFVAVGWRCGGEARP